MPRLLKHKLSCPAIVSSWLSTNTDLGAVSEEPSIEIPSDSLTALQRAIEDDSIYLTTQTPKLSKKRSFLLGDVLDDLEGRPPKRRDTRSTTAQSPAGAIDLQASAYGSARRLKRQASDFDLLYGSARSGVVSVEQPEETPIAHPVLETLPSTTEDWPARGRQLRSKKSMIAMSLERAKAISPSRHRLDQMDTQHFTSFDALLEIPAGFKGDLCGPTLHKDPPAAISFDLTTNPARQLRETSGNVPRLRHVKSAKDILQKYSNRSPPPPKRDVGTVKAARETALRRGLRDLLGKRKR